MKDNRAAARPDATTAPSSQRLPPAYWRQWSASAVSNLGDGMNLAALPLLALALTDDPRLIAAVSFVSFLPWLVLSLPAGVYIDRLDRRRILVTTNLVRGALFGLIAVTAATGVLGIWALLAILLAVGVCEMLFDNSAQAFLPAIVPTGLLPKANGRIYAAEVVTNTFVGLPLGAWLFVAAVGLPFGVNAAAYTASALLVLSIRVPRQRLAHDDEPDRPSFRADLVEGLRWLWGHTFLRNLAILLGITNLGAQLGTAIFVKFAADELGISPAGYGVLLAVISLGAILGGLIGDRIAARLGMSAALIAAYVAFGASQIAIGAFPIVWVVVLASVIEALAAVVWNVVTVSLRQRLIPTELFGRVNSVYRWLGWGTIPIGSLIGGFVAYGIDLRAPYLMGGAISLAGLVVLGRHLLPRRLEAALAEPVTAQP